MFGRQCAFFFFSSLLLSSLLFFFSLVFFFFFPSSFFLLNVICGKLAPYSDYFALECWRRRDAAALWRVAPIMTCLMPPFLFPPDYATRAPRRYCSRYARAKHVLRAHAGSVRARSTAQRCYAPREIEVHKDARYARRCPPPDSASAMHCHAAATRLPIPPMPRSSFAAAHARCASADVIFSAAACFAICAASALTARRDMLCCASP